MGPLPRLRPTDARVAGDRAGRTAAAAGGLGAATCAAYGSAVWGCDFPGSGGWRMAEDEDGGGSGCPGVGGGQWAREWGKRTAGWEGRVEGCVWARGGGCGWEDGEDGGSFGGGVWVRWWSGAGFLMDVDLKLG